MALKNRPVDVEGGLEVLRKYKPFVGRWVELRYVLSNVLLERIDDDDFAYLADLGWTAVSEWVGYPKSEVNRFD